MRKKVLAANWKMHKTNADLEPFFKNLAAATRLPSQTEVIVAPPFTLLEKTKNICLPFEISVAAQNVHFESSGAFTGEVAPAMLKELGVGHVIVGHSERRQYFAEDDTMVAKKVAACFRHHLKPIVCVGETKFQREAGDTNAVLKRQMQAILEMVPAGGDWLVAYEPVWAIGTGLTASNEQAQEAHKYIRELIGERLGMAAAARTRILYGGSVKPENVSGLISQDDIDGGLVGGASLKPEDFASLINVVAG